MGKNGENGEKWGKWGKWGKGGKGGKKSYMFLKNKKSNRFKKKENIKQFK